MNTSYIKRVSVVVLGAIVVSVKSAYAMCPVCTVAVAGALGLSRWLGIDDTVSGIWVGAFAVSSSLWFANWLEKKRGKHALWIRWSIITAMYALIIVPLYFLEMIGHPAHTLWGIDKLVLGILVGSVIFFAMAYLYLWLKKRNGDHAHFPMEKVVLSVGALLVGSGIFYLITK